MEDIIPRSRVLIARMIEFIRRRPRLDAMVRRFVMAHERWQGFREYGLMRDDIISEEPEIIEAALKRLSDKEQFDRAFRLRRAIQLHVRGEKLPKEEQLQAHEVHSHSLSNQFFLLGHSLLVETC